MACPRPAPQAAAMLVWDRAQVWVIFRIPQDGPVSSQIVMCCHMVPGFPPAAYCGGA